MALSNNEHLLIILAEECSEVIQAISKVLRFGEQEIEPLQKLTNIEKLDNELNDLIGVYKMLTDIGILNYPLESYIKNKQMKVHHYMTHSKDIGYIK